MKSSITFASFFALSLAISLLIYGGSLKGEFVYDDLPFVAENRHIENIRNIPSFFTDKETASGELHSIYRPIRTFSYAVDHFFWGKRPFGYHLTNLFLHTINALLVFIIFSSILKNLAVSLLSSLIFLTHPVNTEAVAWISSRGDLLAALFSLASFASYARGARENRPGLSACSSWICFSNSLAPLFSLLLFGAAIFSKESALVLPLALMAYDLSIGRAPVGFSGATLSAKASAIGKTLLFRYGLFLATGAIYVGIRYNVLGEIAQRTAGGQYLSTMLTAPTVLIYYFKLLLFPTDLRLIYAFRLAESAAEARFIASGLILALSLFVLALAYRRSKYLFFSLFWFYLWLLPVSNIVPLKGLIQEHFLYIPSLGIFLAIGYFTAHLSRGKRAAAALLVLIIILYSVLTAYRSAIWAEGETLWMDTTIKSPMSALARNNLGAALISRDRADKAFLQFRAALSILPSHGQAWYNSALGLSAKGNFDRAFLEIARAVQTGAKPWLTYAGYGENYSKSGFKDRAIQKYQAALFSNPNSLQALYNLSVELMLKRRSQAAADGFLRLLELDPENGRAAYNLGSIYQRLGRLDKAAHLYKKTLASGYRPSDLRNNYAALLANKGLNDEAIAEFKSLLSDDPGDGAARNNLAITLAGKGAINAAIEEFQRALTINQSYDEARENFAVALAAAGRFTKALTQYLILEARQKPRAKIRALIGDIYLHLGKSQKALSAYSAALGMVERSDPLSEILARKVAALSASP